MIIKADSKQLPHEYIAQIVFSLARTYKQASVDIAEPCPAGIGADISDWEVARACAEINLREIPSELHTLLEEVRDRLQNSGSFYGDDTSLLPIKVAMLTLRDAELANTRRVADALAQYAPETDSVAVGANHAWNFD